MSDQRKKTKNDGQNEASGTPAPIETQSLVIAFQDIPFEGLLVRTDAGFQELYSPDEKVVFKTPELESAFQSPVHIQGQVLTVGSKIDLRGSAETTISGVCDRCTIPVSLDVTADFSTFLMPKTQFSTHDKPGGKVIHGPTRDSRPSRHHSHSKAKELTDAEGEHEDVHFGAFDGQTLDLRPIIREQLILQIPMRSLCSQECRGLCLKCGENINTGACICKEGPTGVETEIEKDAEKGEKSKKSLSPLAAALSKKMGSS